MRGWFSSLIFGGVALFSVAAPSAANSDLTKAETRVCRTLSHCLKIVETHPMDSFDYQVLVGEFGRYGTKGRDALLKMLRKGGRGAPHAADLLSMSRNASVLAPLRALETHKDDEVKALAASTYETLSLRLDAKAAPIAETITLSISEEPLPSPCPGAKAIRLEAQKREMPFFETRVSSPDQYGAYWPSAPHRIHLRNVDRSDLRTAVSTRSGWLAGYESGLVFYDSATGAPDVRSDAPILSLQRRKARDLNAGVWAIIEAPDGLILADAIALTVTARLRGQLNGLARTTEDHLLLSTTIGTLIRISPDGKISSGCDSPA